jgi:hypothetical protein
VLVDVLLVVGDNGLGDGLTDGVDLGGVTTTSDADADVDTGELVSANDQEGLVDLFEGEEDQVRKKKFEKVDMLSPLPCFNFRSFRLSGDRSIRCRGRKCAGYSVEGSVP